MKPKVTIEPTRSPTEDRVDRAARTLDAQAFAFRYGVAPALGIAGVVILAATSDRPAGLVILTLGTGIVAALILAALLGGFAALLNALARQIDVTARLEHRIAEAVETLAGSVEGGRSVPTPGSDPAAVKSRQLAEAREAIRAGHWDVAGPLVNDLIADHPDDSGAARLPGELAEARAVAGRDRLARIEAARQANDPDRVIELRDGLKPLIDADALRTLDGDLAKWFMTLLHRRLRSGTVGTDVAVLAGRVAASLDDTPEGASLRASLPTLRRAAGLCARCAQPYTGIDDACPACLTGVSATAAHPPLIPSPDPHGVP